MTEQDRKKLASDTDGLYSYEFLANNIEGSIEDIDEAINNMARVDLTGQFMASAARYLHAIDPEKFAKQTQKLVELVIDRDREHRYLADILQGIYGADYEEKAATLMITDNNFRRIYKRLFNNTAI